MWSILLTGLLIFLARLTDVSMGTLRQIMIIRGQRKIGALIGFFEIIIWILAISRVLSNLNQFYNIIAFASGFAMGNYLGAVIEEKIALGYVFAYVVPKNSTANLTEELRKAGFGVTTVTGMGLEGPRPILHIVFKRKDTKQFLNLLKAHDKDAFYTMLDVRAESGGYIRRPGIAKKK